MFTYLTSIVGKLRSWGMEKVLVAALGVLILAVVLGSVSRWLRRRRQDSPEGWPRLIVGALGDVLKVLAGLAVLAAICAHMRFESGEFARRHGGVSERAYEAVKTIWGRPHVQRELGVRPVYTTLRYLDKDGLELDADRLKAATQPVGFRKEETEHVIPGDPILQAEHEIALKMNYRRKGTGIYPGFDADCTFKYRVANLSDRPVTAKFVFPLPIAQGMLDRLAVSVDGAAMDRQVAIEEETLRWELPMAPRAEHDVAVGYHSRGLEHLRFEPGAGRQLRRYRVRILCREMPRRDLNYPVGCMTPTLEREEAGSTILAWDLDNAVTRLGMGVIVPSKKEEGYHVARMLAVGPWGLVLLLAMVIVTHLATGAPLRWVPLALVAVAYHLYHLLAGHLADYWPGLAGGMLMAGSATTAIVVLLYLGSANRLARWASVAMFVFFAFAYPLMRISDYDGLLMSALYVALLAYTVVLLVRSRGLPEGAPAPG